MPCVDLRNRGAKAIGINQPEQILRLHLATLSRQLQFVEGRSELLRPQEHLRVRIATRIDFVPTFVSGPNAEAAPVPNPATDSGPGMLSAMRDQLGLKLQAARAKVEYLVIDHAEKPTPD